MSTPGFGREQRKWLGRIRAAGGEVKVMVEAQPVIMIDMEDGPPIRVPVRMFESLVSRGLFERLEHSKDFEARYRLKESDTVT